MTTAPHPRNGELGHRPRRIATTISALALALLAAGSRPARATPLPQYLSQYVLMMDWVGRSVAYVRRHAADTALAGVAHAVAEQLVSKAERLTPPEQLEDLHPHFLLVLENAERAFYHLSEGDADRADHHFAIVDDETRNMRAIQRDLGIDIPDLTP